MPSKMPATLTGPDGRTYFNAHLTGTALDTDTARAAGWKAGETTHEYWLGDDDTERLHTTADFRMLLD